MQLFVCLVALLGLAVSPLLAYETFNNYSVYRLHPENDRQLEYLQALEDSGLDFWRAPDKINRFADVMVSPADKFKVLAGLSDMGIKSQVIIPDVQRNIDLERAELEVADQRSMFERKRNTRNEAVPNFWNRFQRYAQHVEFCNALKDQNKDLVEVFTLGSSYEKREIKVLRIGIDSSDTKKVIFIEGGIHAREWASPATVTYFAQELINRKDDPTVNALLKKYDFYIVPVLNVDGYEFTHTNSRLWRKTRRPSENKPSCIGADPNRNFGYEWGGVGASTNPCAETYRGDRAFSEFETSAERDFMNQIGPKRIRSYIAVHTYGQYWLYPWGYTSALTDDDDKLKAKAIIATTKLREKYNTKYTYGTSTNVLYAAAGGSDDYAYSLGITYSYTVELRDTGLYGFQLPASQIKPTAEETTEAFIAMFKAISETPGE